MMGTIVSSRNLLISLVVLLSGLNAYQFQNDDLATLSADVSDLSAQTSALARWISPKSDHGMSSQDSRVVRMFVFHEIAGSDPCASSDMSFSIRDYYITDTGDQFFSLGVPQGWFEVDDGTGAGCVQEFLFIGVPSSETYLVRPTSPFQGIASTHYPMWELDSTGWGAYEEVVVNSD